MTSKDFIEAEAGNNGSIIPYREGLFWKAYEKSAYAVCTQIKPLKAIKRRLKSLGGGEIVSVGFPCKHEQKYIGSLEHMETMPDRLVLRTLKPIDGQRFEEWKQELSSEHSVVGRRDACVQTLSRSNIPHGELIMRIRMFNLAESTPMDCMLFVNELKKML